MKPVYQTKFGGSDVSEAEQGNCLAAALASVFELGLDEVPDFAGTLNTTWFNTLSEWLAKRNVMLFPAPIENGHPIGIHMLACSSTTLKNPEDGHVVVIENGNVVHDPNPNSIKEGEREQYWVMACLDPARQSIHLDLDTVGTKVIK